MLYGSTDSTKMRCVRNVRACYEDRGERSIQAVFSFVWKLNDIDANNRESR